MHFITTQTSPSLWNNSRDQMVEFDWQHMFQQSQNIWNTFTPPINVNRSNFFFNLCQMHEISCILKIVSHDCCIDSGEIEEKSEGICYRIPQKEVYTMNVGSFLFSYWISFQQIHLLVCIWYAWNNAGFNYLQCLWGNDFSGVYMDF